MKTILAFGDSLTWGYQAGRDTRHAFEDRWPNVLAAGLGAGFRVIEEGLNGRTTVYPDPTHQVERRGSVALPICLSSHSPLDLVIIMLGTNDLKFAHRCRAFDAALGMARLIEQVRWRDYNTGCSIPEIMIVAPPHLVPTNDYRFNSFWGHAIAESQRFAIEYKRLADEVNVHFFDASLVAEASDRDGGHLDAANTCAIGTALIAPVQRILGV